jgi:hypothetical protein
MNCAAKTWDFVWGAFIAGTLPVIVFWFTWLFAALTVGPLALLLCPVTALAAFYFIFRWRWRHRLLPVQVMPLEVLAGLAIGIFFSVIMIRGIVSIGP